ncbi:hypothetical protein TRFO_22170 [Tritrichomonas foetus]|uniref:Uncharacterized protein n=1 Tax=Tritrichomonas foetus TaxID=1144522 RepID=A0A1J4KH96_9EUKA|nr:hypothetical protein TRFO_22170 [Tritrichomonas foetus]|eukprot:OHT09022.1 hypothetical protein TRFO_22170 [Tritrichomonas foetus]
MHVLMMIANLKPQEFQDALTNHQPQMIRLFGSISDQNDQVSNKFVSTLPILINGNSDFQQVVGFYALEALVGRINRERPEFLNALLAVLNENLINQSLFVKNGYLKNIENMIKTPDQKILDLMDTLFNPNTSSQSEVFQQFLESTSIINYLCDNIIRGVLRPSNIHILSICIRNNKVLTQRIIEKINDFVRLALENNSMSNSNSLNNLTNATSTSTTNVTTNATSTTNNFEELFESFMFNSDENTHLLNSFIQSESNSVTDNFLNLCIFSILTAPNCKDDFSDVYQSLLLDIKHRSMMVSLFQFFVCICWESKQYCELLSEHLDSLFQLQFDEKVADDIKNMLNLLFVEIVFFTGKNKAKIGVINTSIAPSELISKLNSLILDNSTKFGKFTQQLIEFANENAQQLANSQSVSVNDSNDLEEIKKLNEIENNKNLARIEELKSLINEKDGIIQSANSEINELKNHLNGSVEIDEHMKIKEENNELKLKIEQLNQTIEDYNNISINNNNDQEIAVEQNQTLLNQINELTSNLEEKERSNSSIQSQNEELKSQNEELKSQNEELKSQNEELQNINEEIQSKIKELNTKLTEKVDLVTSIQAENEQLRNKIEKKAKESSEMAEKYNREISMLLSQQDKSGDDLIRSLNDQIKSYKNEIDEQRSGFENIKETFSQNLSDLQDENSKLKAENQSLLESNKELQSKISDNNLEKNSFKDNLENLQQIEHEIRNENDILKQQIKEMNLSMISKETFNLLKEEHDSISRKLKDFENKTEFNQQNNEFEQNKNLEKEKELENAILELTEKNKSLENSLEKERKKKESNHKIAEELRKTNGDLSSQVNLMKHQIEELESIVQNSNFNLQQEDFNAIELKAQIKHLNSQIEEMEETRYSQEKVDELNKVIENLRNENNNLQKICAIKEDHEKLISKQKVLIDDLKKENEKLQELSLNTDSSEKLQKLQTQNSSLKKELRSISLELKSIKTQNETQVEDFTKRLELAKKEKNQLILKLKKQKESSVNQNPNEISSSSFVSLNNSNINNNEEVEKLKKQIIDLQSTITSLKSENIQLKNAPEKALIAALQSDKQNLEVIINQLKEEVRELNDKISKQMYKQKKQNKKKSFDSFDSTKLMREIEILKRDNENQSHTISDLQMMLSSTNSASQINIESHSFSPIDYRNISVENEILSSQLKEFKAMDSENKRLNKENMELKKMIRQRNTFDSPSMMPSIESPRSTSGILSPDDRKKASRVIGKLWYDQHQQDVL